MRSRCRIGYPRKGTPNDLPHGSWALRKAGIMSAKEEALMARRTFNREFKTSAARLVREQGYSAAQAATSLGVDPRSIRDWVAKFAPPPVETPGAASDVELRQENERLRAENKRLLMEREILKKRRRSSRGNSREVRLRPRPPGRVSRRAALRRARRFTERLLRLAGPSAEPNGPPPRAPHRADSRGPRGGAVSLWLAPSPP